MAKQTFTARIRFNWGFWDGRNDGLSQRTAVWGAKNHPDRVYESGYWAGRATVGETPETSDAAWQASGLSR